MIANTRRGAQLLPARQRSNLGFIDLDDAIDIVEGIFGEQYPLDAGRLRQADQLEAQALSGDRQAYLRLKCLAALATPQEAAEYRQLSGGDCGSGWPTTGANARAVAAQKVQNIDMQQAGGGGILPENLGATVSKYGPALALAAVLGFLVLPAVFAGPKGRARASRRR